MLEFVFPWLFLLLPLPLLLRFLPEYLQQNQMVKVPFFNKLIEISGDKAKLGAKTQQPSRLQKSVLIISGKASESQFKGASDFELSKGIMYKFNTGGTASATDKHNSRNSIDLILNIFQINAHYYYSQS